MLIFSSPLIFLVHRSFLYMESCYNAMKYNTIQYNITMQYITILNCEKHYFVSFRDKERETSRKTPVWEEEQHNNSWRKFRVREGNDHEILLYGIGKKTNSWRKFRGREGNNPGKVRARNRYTERIAKIPGTFRAGVRDYPGKFLVGNRYTHRNSKNPGKFRSGVREHPGKVRFETRNN